MQTKTNAGVLNEREAARYLGMSVHTLQRWRSDRRGPRFLKLGAAVRYRECDLLAFLEGNEVQPIA
jgi:predicted DNA-binding transcriptional regulator AlpA